MQENEGEKNRTGDIIPDDTLTKINPVKERKIEDQKSWTGEIVTYLPEFQDDLYRFGKTMWERDLGRTWNPPERQKDLIDVEESYQRDGGEFWVAKAEDGGIVGCAGLKPYEDKDSLEFARYYVLSDMQGKKIGKGLIHKAIHYAVDKGRKSIVLDTNSEKSKDAIRIFEFAGFKEIPPYKTINASQNQAPSNLFMKLDLTDYECPFCKKKTEDKEDKTVE